VTTAESRGQGKVPEEAWLSLSFVYVLGHFHVPQSKCSMLHTLQRRGTTAPLPAPERPQGSNATNEHNVTHGRLPAAYGGVSHVQHAACCMLHAACRMILVLS
jgi:hypothetical protein